MRKKGNWLLCLLFVILMMLTGCSGESIAGNTNKEQLKVHFLDVGQADCAILQIKDAAIIIDAGNNDDEAFIISYLEKLGIKKLDYAIGTHSHEDHVGSMDSVLKNVEVNHIILPNENISTKTYRDVWKVIEEKKVDVIRPQVGETYTFGEASFQILSPTDKEYHDTNDYSVSLLVTYGKNKFLFTGDASESVEKEILERNLPIEADVFQAGHHGSSTSNSIDFLKKADPSYAVISCGKDNSYGHPHAETVAAFEDMDIQMYRTDLQGTVIATSDGKNISWKVEKSIALEDQKGNSKEQKDTKAVKKQTYILNTNSRKFHHPDCSSTEKISEKNKEVVKSTRIELIREGYDPCKTCNP